MCLRLRLNLDRSGGLESCSVRALALLEAAKDLRSNMTSGIEPHRRYSEAERQEEEKRIRHLRRLVDFTLALIAQSAIPLEEAQKLINGVRKQAYYLFPDKKDTFELIYTPRFRRLLAEKYRLQ